MTTSYEAPLLSPVMQHLQRLYEECRRETSGEVATYIPELAKADPDWFGICLVTATGAIYEVGDSRQPFTIQSISKPFVYGLALEDQGRAEVERKVGVEPTGDAFNSISLEPGSGRPRNPMINAGAIATTGLVLGKSAEGRFRRIQDMLSAYAGRELPVDDTVYRSESETGHRNRAIGHMLRNFDILTSDPTPVLEMYFRQCAVSVTCRDLGVMAATLANRGVNPVTGKQAIRGEYVESVLGVMSSCGMYDFAGEWIFRVGLPAKSGVAGGVLAVLPGQLGIGVFSPRLDPHGNSVRGIRVCQELSRHFDLHLFSRPAVGRSTIRLKFNAAELNSSRVRTPVQAETLRQHGRQIVTYQLQGHLSFSTAEVLVRDVMDGLGSFHHLLIDLKRVLSVNESASRLLFQLVESLEQAGKKVVFTHTGHLSGLRRYMRLKMAETFELRFVAFESNDLALEWCENQLLESHLPGHRPAEISDPAHYDLLEGLSAAELATVMPLLETRSCPAGATIIQIGDAAREIFFLTRGHVSVMLPEAKQPRLATFSPGMSFGEMAFIDGAPRSAMIVADTDVTCHVLGVEHFQRLGTTHPAIKIKILEQISRDLCRKLRKANRERSVLD